MSSLNYSRQDLTETKRLENLYSYDLLDTPEEKEFDALTKLASEICNMPVSLITLLDSERQWFKSKKGTEVGETDRSLAFCNHTILGNEVFEVEDLLADVRFSENPLVTDDPKVRFYAGAPLIDENGFALGSLCVLDVKPGKLSDWQKEALGTLANEVISRMELRKHRTKLEKLVAKQTEHLLEINKELEDKNFELQDFIYHASHDLRGPVSSILGMTQLISHPLTHTQEEIQQYNHMLHNLAVGMDQTIRNLIRSHSLHEHKIQFGEVDLNEMLQEIRDSYNLRFEDVDVVLNLCDSKVNSDFLLLDIILRNLVHNACNFHPEDSNNKKAEVFTNIADKQLHISVKDNGSGIPKKLLDKVHKMFVKAATQNTGSGLGLYLVSSAVKLLNGSLVISSEVNVGTEVSVSIPLH